MKKMKLVMVGNGMAGVRTLEELLKIAPDLYDITSFSRFILHLHGASPGDREAKKKRPAP